MITEEDSQVSNTIDIYANLFFSEYFLHISLIRRNTNIHVITDISDLWTIETVISNLPLIRAVTEIINIETSKLLILKLETEANVFSCGSYSVPFEWQTQLRTNRCSNNQRYTQHNLEEREHLRQQRTNAPIIQMEKCLTVA
jgi:hypothetical protein